MKLSEIRNILREEDIQLTRSLGQNFLQISINCERSLPWPSSILTTRFSRSDPGWGR